MSHDKKPLVLVTGASGYIATHIIKLLLDQGYRVRGTVRNLKDTKKVNPLKSLSSNAEKNLQLVEADLLKPENWENAVNGCTYVIHTASPFPSTEPAHPDDLIKPAVDGTMQILRACATSGSVKRVVLTSSVAAVMNDGNSAQLYNEEDWTNPDDSKLISYSKSKTLAELAAWDFVKDNKSFDLAVINPGFVMGPLIHDSDCTSAELMQRLMTFEVPALAKLSFSVVDVRDVAHAHVKAMTEPSAGGKRHILVNRTMWVQEIAEEVGSEFRPQGYRIPWLTAPYPFVWVLSLFDKGVKLILGSVGKFPQFDNSRMKVVLGIEPIDVHKTIVDMAYSLVERGFVKKTQKYKSPVEN